MESEFFFIPQRDLILLVRHLNSASTSAGSRIQVNKKNVKKKRVSFVDGNKRLSICSGLLEFIRYV